MYGCTDVRMYGCTDVRMYGCTDERMYGGYGTGGESVEGCVLDEH